MMSIMQCKELFVDINDKTYKLGKLTIRDIDFYQWPHIELLDPNDYERPMGYLPIYSIYTRMCKPKTGVFENPSHIERTIIETQKGMDTKRLIVRTQKVKSKGDTLDII